MIKIKKNNYRYIRLNEVTNKLVDFYNEGKFLCVVEEAQVLLKQFPKTFVIWNIFTK